MSEEFWAVPDHFVYRRFLGRGAYGCVAEFEDTTRGELVAIKRIGDVFDDLEEARRILREIKLLRHFRNSEGIITLKGILPLNSLDFQQLYIITEALECDLYNFIQMMGENHPDEELTRRLFFSMLSSLATIHDANIIHRDIKPSNILISHLDYPTAKVCDFGLATHTSSSSFEKLGGTMTEYVVTRWYRPPEVLLNTGHYDKAVDIWGLGCIFMEFIQKTPLFPGRDSCDQLKKIVEKIPPPVNLDGLFKTPSNELSQATVAARNLFRRIRVYENQRPKNSFGGIFGGIHDALLQDLLVRMLAFDPRDRLTATQGLNHPYFEKLTRMRFHAAAVRNNYVDWTFDRISKSVQEVKNQIFVEVNSQIQWLPLRMVGPVKNRAFGHPYYWTGNRSMDISRLPTTSTGEAASPLQDSIVSKNEFKEATVQLRL